MVMAPPPMHDSAVSPCFHGLPPLAFPTKISFHTSPQSISLHSPAALTLGLLHIPLTPAPSHCPFQKTSVPAWGMYGCGKDCLILLFRLPQLSCFTLSLECFSSDSDNCPHVRIRPLLQFPHPLRAGPVLPTLLVFPQLLHPTEFCVVPYFLFCWSGPPVHSQLVFCMHFCV